MAQNKKKDDIIDIRGLFDSYIKHWWWFLISICVCGLIAVVYIKSHNRMAGIHANIQVTEDNTASFTSLSGVDNIFGSSAWIEDEIFIIGSHSLFRDVAKELGVNELHYVKTGWLKTQLAYPKYPVDVFYPAELADTLSQSIVFETTVYPDGKASVKAEVDNNTIAKVSKTQLPVTLSTDWGKFVINTTPSYNKKKKVKSTIVLSGYDAAAEEINDLIITTKASKKANVISLYVESSNAKYAQDILNTLLALYNKEAISQKNSRAEKTLEFLDQRIGLISGDLASTESNIENFKEERGIVDVGSEASYNINAKAASEAALVQAQTNQEMLRITRDFLSQPANAYELIPSTGDMGPAASAISTYNTLVLRRMDLMQNARGNNKALKRLEGQIDAMRATINATLDKAYESSNVAVREARAQLSKAEGKLSNIPTQERQFRDLQRQQTVKQQLYLFLLQRREETAMMVANALPKGRIIDEAYVQSQPIGMSKKGILAIALFLGLIIPPVLLYLRGLFRTKVETLDEVRKLTDVPVLGEICEDKSGKTLVVRPNETSSTIELFSMARSALQFILSDKDDKVITVTSTRPSEGKSFISTNLAASLSLINKRVLLIGLDIRSPRLGEYLGVSSAVGVTNLLASGMENLDKAIIREPLQKNMDVLLAGPVPPNPSELINSEVLDRMFKELRERYDYIVVDSAPVGMVSDTFNIMRISDATIYVCRVNHTTKSDIKFLNDAYQEKRLVKPALIVNGTKTKKGYGYGYGENKK